MKKLLFPIFVLLIAASCASIKVSSDFDKTAQFSGYKTYAFTPEALNLNIEELNRKRLITAVENELSLKGFTKSENPDVLIDIKITGEKKQTATATSTGGYMVTVTGMAGVEEWVPQPSIMTAMLKEPYLLK